MTRRRGKPLNQSSGDWYGGISATWDAVDAKSLPAKANCATQPWPEPVDTRRNSPGATVR
jgi:hypothetical protein